MHTYIHTYSFVHACACASALMVLKGPMCVVCVSVKLLVHHIFLCLCRTYMCVCVSVCVSVCLSKCVCIIFFCVCGIPIYI